MLLLLAVAALVLWTEEPGRQAVDAGVTKPIEQPAAGAAGTGAADAGGVAQAPLPAREAAGPSFRLLSELPRPVISHVLPEDPAEPVPPGVFMVRRSVEIDPASLAALRDLPQQAEISFPVPGGGFLNGTVRLRVSESEALHLAGSLEHGAGSQFTLTFRGEEVYGLILEPARGLAYEVAQLPGHGRPILQQRPIQAVQCEGIPKPPGNSPDRFSNADGPLAAVTVPLLESLPGASEVLYLDFDGEVVTDPSWAGGSTIIAAPAEINGNPITPAQITQVWQYVSEDFRPFKVNVTTDVTRYDSAQVGRRMRCIITPTTDAGPGTGGVAYRDSFSEAGSGWFSSNIPCWAFVDGSTVHQALVISHELGHTLGLAHQGLAAWTDPDDGRIYPYQEYYSGHGTGTASWGPIMGAPYFRNFTQWTKGEFFRAYRGPGAAPHLRQDDVALISRAANHFGLKADDVGDSIAAAKLVSGNLFGHIDETGLIHTSADADFYRFTSAGGTLNVSASPIPAAPNLKILLQLRDAGNNLIAESNPSGLVTASINRSISAGTWFLVVMSGDNGAPLNNPPTGFTNHGSLGDYTLTGTFPPLPVVPFITQEPVPAIVDEGKLLQLAVGALSNSPIKYQWFRTPPGGVETAVAGATSASYQVSKASATHIGSYRVRLTNSTGVAWSEEAQVVVRLKPKITTQPTDVTLAAGEAYSFEPPHIGEPPLDYQWYRNGNAIAGETGPALAGLAAWETGALYRLEITNALGTAVSRTFRVRINAPPILIHAPPLFAVPAGGSATMAFQVVGTPVLSFQWLKNGVEIQGATKPSLRLNGVPGTVGTYQLRVTNLFGVETSTGTEVVVDQRLRITRHPEGGVFTRTDAVELSVDTEGDGPVTYQWQFKGVDLPGETGQTLTIPSATWFHNGAYRVIVQNRVSKVISKPAVLRVSSRPEIVLQPQSAKGARRGTHAFVARVAGTAHISYQWFKDGQPLPGATQSRLPLRNLDVAHEGEYHVVATNSLGSISSDPATLIVEDPPKILTQPLAGYFPVTGEVTASVTTTGAPVLQYQWQRNRRDLPGQNGPVLSLPNAALSASGSYRVVVKNDVGRVFSRAVALTVQIPPKITVQPQPLTIYEGEKAVFTVAATGSKTLRYRWLHNGVEVSRSRTLTLKDARVIKQGEYQVEVSNRVGSELSHPVILTTLSVPTPEITRLVPLALRPGEKFALVGAHLQHVRTVRVGGRSVSFVKTPGNQVIGTLPGDMLSAGVVSVTSLGGSAQAPAPLILDSAATNDLFANARILTGSAPKSAVSNLDFTSETGEPFPNRGRSAWWRWVAPSTGLFNADTALSSYDTILAVYQGDALDALNLMAWNDDDNAAGVLTSRLAFNAIQGATYRIVVDVYSLTGGGGPTALNLNPLKSSSPVSGALDGAGLAEMKAGAAPAAAAQGVENTALTFELPVPEVGGAEEESVLWRATDREVLTHAGTVSLSFDASLLVDGGDVHSDDLFSWTFYDSNDEPLLALGLAAADGRFFVATGAGEMLEPEPRLAPNTTLRIELELDLERDAWSLLLDGAVLFQGMTLGTGADTVLQDIAISALRGASPMRARLSCENMEVTTRPRAAAARP